MISWISEITWYEVEARTLIIDEKEDKSKFVRDSAEDKSKRKIFIWKSK